MTGVLAVLLGSGNDLSIELQDADAFSTGFDVQTASFRMKVDRFASVGEDGVFTDVFQWCADYADPADYEVRATIVSGGGAMAGDATGAWLDFTTGRTWSTVDANVDATPENAVLTIEVRRAGGTRILASCTASLSADRT